MDELAQPVRWLLQSAVSLYLGVLFAHAGLDKLINWRESKEQAREVLARGPLRRVAGFSFGVLTLLESVSGVLLLSGFLVVLLGGISHLAMVGAALGTLVLVMVLLGQRLSREYTHAAANGAYFVIALLALVILAPR